jgi:hypothetical protein
MQEEVCSNFSWYECKFIGIIDVIVRSFPALVCRFIPTAAHHFSGLWKSQQATAGRPKLQTKILNIPTEKCTISLRSGDLATVNVVIQLTDWVVTCGLVDGCHCLGGSNGDATPTSASVPVYQFTLCHSVGDCKVSTVILFFHNIVWHSALSFGL